jgi:hypothetical protein
MRPLVAGDRIFVRRLTKRGIELACLGAADGQVRWAVRPDGHVVSDPVLMAGKLLAVVATTPQSGLLQLDLASFQPDSGNIVSQQSLMQMRDEWGGRPPCELVAAAGRLVCTSGGATLCCDTLGRPQWLHRQTWLPPDVVAPDVRIDGSTPSRPSSSAGWSSPCPPACGPSPAWTWRPAASSGPAPCRG